MIGVSSVQIWASDRPNITSSRVLDVIEPGPEPFALARPHAAASI